MPALKCDSCTAETDGVSRYLIGLIRCQDANGDGPVEADVQVDLCVECAEIAGDVLLTVPNAIAREAAAIDAVTIT